MQGLIDYVLSKTSVDQGFHSALSSLLQNHPRHHVGLVLSERLINMPVQIMPPMYRMLSDEIDEAIKEVRLLFAVDSTDTDSMARRVGSRISIYALSLHFACLPSVAGSRGSDAYCPTKCEAVQIDVTCADEAK